MDERELLTGQVHKLLGELIRVQIVINTPQMDAALRARIQARFALLIQTEIQKVQSLLQQIQSGTALDVCWDGLGARQASCGPLFQECLALVQGALMRQNSVDEGLCSIADALLDDLSHTAGIPWGRFTILAEGEFFAYMAEIIRLRFPEVSIWSLPIALHEFGHFVAQGMSVRRPDSTWRYPFQERKQRETDRQSRDFLEEHFADLFATYAGGPGFACACILGRFDPVSAYRDGARHPATARRVYVVLKTLAKMDAAEGGINRPYRGIIEYLEGTWRRSLLAIGKPESLDSAVTIPLDALAEELYVLVRDNLPPDVRYRGWRQAENLATMLDPNATGAPDPQGKVTLTDVLNAAWLCRIANAGAGNLAVQQIGSRAVALCRRMMTSA